MRLCLIDTHQVICQGQIVKLLFSAVLGDKKISVAQVMIAVFDRVENIVGNGWNAACQHILPFPQHDKRLLLMVIKIW